MLPMKNKPPRDERLQLIKYKAGYYAFVFSFPMMVLTILLFAGDSTRDTIYTPIAAFVTFWTGLGVFVGYPWKMKAGEAEREMMWKQFQLKKNMKQILLVLVGVFALTIVGVDYLITVYLDQETYHFAKEWPRYIFATGLYAAIYYYTAFRKPKHLRGADGED